MHRDARAGAVTRRASAWYTCGSVARVRDARASLRVVAMPRRCSFRAAASLLVASVAVAACDDGPMGTTTSRPGAAALLVNQSGGLQALPGVRGVPPRSIGRVGDQVHGCAARRTDGGGVLLTVSDSTNGNRRFVIVDPQTGAPIREVALDRIERSTPDSARLDLGFPSRCVIDPRASRLVTPARVDGRLGLAVLSLDSARMIGFVRTDLAANGAAFGSWRNRPALLVARYPLPIVPLARLALYAHDPVTLVPFDSLLVPGSEQAFDVRVFPVSGTQSVSVAFGGRVSTCQPSTCLVSLSERRYITLIAATPPGGSAGLLGTTVDIQRGGAIRGQVHLLSALGSVVEIHDLGAVVPTAITVDPLTGWWIVTASPRRSWGGARLTSDVGAPPVFSGADGVPVLGLVLPDLVIVYDPFERRDVRRDPIPVGTVALVGLR